MYVISINNVFNSPIKENPIFFRKPGGTGCFAVVARLLVKPILGKVETMKSLKFQLPLFFFLRLISLENNHIRS